MLTTAARPQLFPISFSSTAVEAAVELMEVAVSAVTTMVEIMRFISLSASFCTTLLLLPVSWFYHGRSSVSCIRSRWEELCNFASFFNRAVDNLHQKLTAGHFHFSHDAFIFSFIGEGPNGWINCYISLCADVQLGEKLSLSPHSVQHEYYALFIRSE